MGHLSPEDKTKCIWFLIFAITKIISNLVFKVCKGKYNGDWNNTINSNNTMYLFYA